ncbi:hypothetical protein OK016_20025 [Vibrio chagasii]|nr:hypothetical protein [Vibrio chagasii]
MQQLNRFSAKPGVCRFVWRRTGSWYMALTAPPANVTASIIARTLTIRVFTWLFAFFGFLGFDWTCMPNATPESVYWRETFKFTAL